MEQFTKEQAIAIYKSGEWKDWTDEEKVKVQLYQKKCLVPFSEFHKAVGRVLQRPVFTHEFLHPQALKNEFEGLCNAPTFEEIVNLIPEEKRIFIEL